MTKLAFAVLLAFPVLALANDTDHAVMKVALAATAHANHVHHVAPAVVRSNTSGGADSFAGQWITKVAGDVIGQEIAASYTRGNADQEDVNDYFPRLVKTVDVDEPYDWSKISTVFPAANALMVFSRPAYDSLRSVGLVRADVIPRHGSATTTFYEIEHQPDGQWKVKIAAVGAYDSVRRTDTHLAP